MHLQEGSLGLYACDLYSMSEINRKEKMYDKQLHLLTLSAYTHLSGIDTLDEYTYWKNGDFSIVEPHPLLPPAIIRSLRLCIKRLNMSIDEYRNFYVDTITPTLTPAHVFGVRKTLDIICAYMEGDIEKADKMVANGTKNLSKNTLQKAVIVCQHTNTLSKVVKHYGMPISITPTGLGKRSISVNEGSKHRGKQKIMRGPFWISKAVQTTYSFLPLLQIILKIWNTA